MTDEQINLAIHKAVGFEWNDERKLWERHANKARVASHKPFYYSSDLNLMHEAEKTLTNSNMYVMEYHIKAMGKGHGFYFHATSRQRAEAFLRTLGKWEEAVVKESLTVESTTEQSSAVHIGDTTEMVKEVQK